jgi:hypothetical protein
VTSGNPSVGFRPSADGTYAVRDRASVPVSEEQDNVEFTNPGIVRVEFDLDPLISMTEYNGSAYISGGMVWQYDGATPIEAGFLQVPETGTVTTSTDGSGTLDGNSAYFYNIRWQWTDEQGKRLLSAAQLISLGPESSSRVSENSYRTDDAFNYRFISVANDTVTIDVDAFSLTRKSADLGRVNSKLIAFKTPANGILRYRFDDGSLEVDVQNTVDLALVDLGVVEPNLDLAERGFTINEFDYTNSGELENVAPFGAKLLISHDDRIFYVPNEDQNKVYFSKRPDAFSQPGFNEVLFIQAPQDGETITALGVMDNKLVIFKRSKIYMVSGDGPNNLGIGAYTLPRLVSTDTGCKDFRSVVRMPAGLMFQSDKGIYILNRGEAVQYIGKPVEAFNDQDVTAATLIADTNEVRFLSSDERTLVFDYEFGTWTTFTNHEGLDAIIHDNTYKYLRLDGQVWEERAEFFKDGNANIKARIEFPWYRPQGMQKLWRCIRVAFLGEFLSNHQLRIKTAINYRNYDEYSVVWDPSQALNLTTWGSATDWGSDAAWGVGDLTKPDRVYQVRHVPKIQKVQSIKFTIEEIPPEDPGAGFELTGVALEAGSYGGVFRLASSKTV